MIAEEPRVDATRVTQLARALEDELARLIVGQKLLVRDTVIALIGGGHVLLEGVPGLGKTVLVRSLGQALSMMKAAADQKKIKVEATVDPAIPLVYADPDRILEVLINLIDNGIKFTPEGGEVNVNASMVETDPTAVYISVTDTGRRVWRGGVDDSESMADSVCAISGPHGDGVSVSVGRFRLAPARRRAGD